MPPVAPESRYRVIVISDGRVTREAFFANELDAESAYNLIRLPGSRKAFASRPRAGAPFETILAEYMLHPISKRGARS